MKLELVKKQPLKCARSAKPVEQCAHSAWITYTFQLIKFIALQFVKLELVEQLIIYVIPLLLNIVHFVWVKVQSVHSVMMGFI